jgi:DNA-binding transcriptional MocR family regulator
MRRLMLDTARGGGVPILEDVTHTEWLLETPVLPALAVLDATGRVIPICDLSDEIGGPHPGAVAAGSSKLLERLRHFPAPEGFDRLSQRVLAAALDHGGRVRAQRVLREKRGLLRASIARFLNRHLASTLGHEFSAGFDAVRVDLPDDVAGSELRDEARRHGVLVWSATDCGAPKKRDRFVLLDLTRHEEGEILNGIRRLGAAFDALDGIREETD